MHNDALHSDLEYQSPKQVIINCVYQNIILDEEWSTRSSTSGSGFERASNDCLFSPPLGADIFCKRSRNDGEARNSQISLQEKKT